MNHQKQKKNPQQKSGLTKVLNIISGNDKSSPLQEHDPYDRRGNLEDFLQSPKPAKTRNSRKASMANIEASRASGAGGSDLKPLGLEIYTEEAAYFEGKKLAKAEAKTKAAKQSISPPSVSKTPSRGESNPFEYLSSTNVEPPIKSVPKHTVQVQHSGPHHSVHGSVSSRMTRMSDFMSDRSASKPPPMPRVAERPRMPQSNASQASSYRADASCKKASMSTKQTGSYAAQRSDRASSGRADPASVKADGGSVKTTSNHTGRIGAYPAEDSRSNRSRGSNGGSSQRTTRPSRAPNNPSHRLSTRSGSTVRNPQPTQLCRFCNDPASPTKQYRDINLNLCTRCANEGNPFNSERISKAPYTRSLTNPTCHLCNLPVSISDSVHEGTSYLCHPCAARAFHPAPKRSPTDPPCQVCHNPVSPMHAVIDRNNYLCRSCSDRAFVPPSPMAPPTPLKDPRHRSPSLGRRSRQVSPHTRRVSPSPAPLPSNGSESTHMSDFDFSGSDSPIIPHVALLSTSRTSSPARSATGSGTYVGRRIPPPSSVYPDTQYVPSPPPSPPPVPMQYRRRPSAASSVYSTATAGPRHAYTEDEDIPAVPEINPAFRTLYNAGSQVDLSTLVPPELTTSKQAPKQTKGIKGKGRANPTPPADVVAPERYYEAQGEGDDGARDTKFYAFYDDIIPGGKSRAGSVASTRRGRRG